MLSMSMDVNYKGNAVIFKVERVFLIHTAQSIILQKTNFYVPTVYNSIKHFLTRCKETVF